MLSHGDVTLMPGLSSVSSRAAHVEKEHDTNMCELRSLHPLVALQWEERFKEDFTAPSRSLRDKHRPAPHAARHVTQQRADVGDL